VVKGLRSALLGEEPDASAAAAVKAEVHAAAKGRGENAEAYRLYLQGRFFEDRLTREDAAKAIGYYRQALELDPEYALAWAGLSRAHSNQGGYSWDVEVTEAFAKTREAAERALQLDPDLARDMQRWGRSAGCTTGIGRERMHHFVARWNSRRGMRRSCATRATLLEISADRRMHWRLFGGP
jgi:tetratricopeptide (TPR) repeat protein